MNPTSPNLTPPTIIKTPDALARIVSEVRQYPYIALDTESNSLFAYYEQVCLIQISTPRADYLVDPLALDDLTLLGQVIANPGIEKVFHAAEYDIMTLRRDFDFDFTALFDTQLAARILGWDKIGLAAILEHEFGVRVSKRFQRANWGARPLKKEMLRYAQIDTHFLLPLRDRLHTELTEAGHLEEAYEAFDELLSIGPFVSEFDPDGFWSIHGAHDLAPQQRAILRELYLFREEEARRRDVPPFKVMLDESMLHIARRQPSSRHNLYHMNGLSKQQTRRYADRLLACVRRGQKADTPRRPRRPRRPDDAVVARFDALRNWRKKRARKRGVESDVIMSKDVLWQLARKAPRNHEQLSQIKDLGPWKREIYGDELLRVLGGEKT